MEQPQLFRIGDRIRTTQPIGMFPAGVQGIIRTLFPFADLYDVGFDEHTELRVVHRDKLELLGEDTAASSHD